MAFLDKKHRNEFGPTNSDKLLPLPLVPIERYLLADNRATSPMVFPMEFDLSGEIDQLAFDAALKETLVNHPLLRVHVEFRLLRKPRFVDAQGQMPKLDWDMEGVPLRFQDGMAIDLRREVGLRIWVRQGSGRATLTFQFHHACCDGIGAGRFLGDLFAAYGKRTTGDGKPPTGSPVTQESLRTRGVFRVEFPEPLRLRQIVWATLCEAAKWITRRPTPLAIPPRSAESPSTSKYPGVESYRFDEEESRALRQHASRQGATVNDILLRDLFQTMRDWNKRYSTRRSGRWLQINMPQSLRRRDDDQMPAANKMSYVFLARQIDELDDSQKLLEGIRAETDAIKEWSLGLYFVAGLGAALKVPGLLSWFVRSNRCFATAVLSNLGDFSRRFVANFPRENGRIVLGNLRLENYRMVPPYRPLTRACMVVSMYVQCLNIHLHCDPSCFSPAGTREFLSQYVARIKETIAEARAAGPSS